MSIKHIVALFVFIAILGCSQPRASWTWTCRATHDIQCSQGDCVAADDQGIVPIEASINASGEISMCVYSGCWEGTGQVMATKQFHSVLGENLPWNSPDIDDFMDVFVSVDIGDGVAVAKAGRFAVPMICESTSGTEVE